MRESPRRTLRFLGRRAVWCVRLAAAAYLVVLLLLMFFENAFIFPAPKYPRGDWSGEQQFENVVFNTTDGVALNGWFLEHPRRRACVLYFHGNGENIAHLGWLLDSLSDRLQASVFVFDYRGYGRSGGKPSEKGVLTDAHAAHAWLRERTNLQSDEIILMGRSLGGALAVDLAAEQGAQGLVLENTFTSIPDVAASHYPWAPVHWLMKTQMRSVDKIPRYPGPLLQTHGDADRVVPFALGERLFEAAPGPKQFIHVRSGRHNDPPSREYETALEQFVRNLTAKN